MLDTVDLDYHAYAVGLGGRGGGHLFISSLAGHDPAEIAANPTAQLLLAGLL